MALRRRTETLERLAASSAAQLDVAYQGRPCILFFSTRGGLLTLADAESGRTIASLQRMPKMEPLRIVGDVVVWDDRQMTITTDTQHGADAERFVDTVNRRSPGSSLSEQLAPSVGESTYDGPRWQFAVINIGMFSAMTRFQRALGVAAQHGWELVGVYDKASNWLSGMEKGFVLLKRPVGDGVEVRDDEWCVLLNLEGT